MTVSGSAEAAAFALPSSAEGIVGREEMIVEAGKRLAGRFVSIVGPGGIGKTTVAIAVANTLLSKFDGAVRFLELSALDDPRLVDSTVVAAFGLPIQADDPTQRLVSHLAGKRTLLVLDCCERVVSRVARLVERLLQQLPDLHVLTTSREVLGADGEDILRLPPLGNPPDTPHISASMVLSFPAVQLFAQRAANASTRSLVNDELAPLVASMCRKLGGLPLAIELVAAQVRDHGVRETAALLDSQFALRWPGRRTAPPRQQTLNATLDWSYNLLADNERWVLRQLSVFAGGFTLEAACAVVGGAEKRIAPVPEIVASLFAKSLVSMESGPANRYRLLDSTRTYAASKLTDHTERQALRRRHVKYFSGWLKNAASDTETARRNLGLMRPDNDNVRIALDWAFSGDGDLSLAVELADHSAPLWLGQSLLTECRDWMLKGIAAIPRAAEVTTQRRLSIQLALASAEMFSVGLSRETAALWTKALELAEDAKDVGAQLTCGFVIWGWEVRETWYTKALASAERYARAANSTSDAGAIATSEWMIGHIQHHLGLLDQARQNLERGLDTDPEDARLAQIAAVGYDRKVDRFVVLANTLWTQGLFDQAREFAQRGLAEARVLDLTSAFGVARTWVGFNDYLSAADLDAVERDMVELIDHGRAHALKTEEGFGLCVLGLCRIKRQGFEAAAAMVTDGLRMLIDAHMPSFNAVLLAHLAEAASAAGRQSEAQALLQRLTREDRNPEHWCTPELLRVRAAVAAAAGDGRAAERLLQESLGMAARQGALAWQLKSATALAKFLVARGHGAEALRVLAPIYSAITEGFDLPDVRAAKQVLDSVGDAQAR